MVGLNDLTSLLGSSASHPAEVPSVGGRAPPLEGIDYSARPHAVAFVRHCGCPFAAKEVRSLGALHKQHHDLGVIVISHSAQEVADDWFSRIGKPHFDSLDRVKIIGDPSLAVQNSFGIGQLGWTKMISPSVIGDLKALAKEGIVNTETGDGSNRWLNSGGFAVDKEGIVRFVKIAEQASDVVDYEALVRTIL